MDTSRGVINIHSETSSKGKEVSNTMSTDSEYSKLRLRQRFNQLNEKVGDNNKTNDLSYKYQFCIIDVCCSSILISSRFLVRYSSSQ
jgi:hypothetical protein